ncbi:hypothetical protein FGO68_gene11437 [Halteria grandinella]|uniref:Uncharacterized protein n=1 Tax=Halteria grandinella TaxID=5974 RepID=A0A8J8P0M0_HALGN|nr:hypothetical protein FGO68_gene11437 [Halteria grandinella]
MYRVRIWLIAESPERLQEETKKMRVLSWILLPIIIVNQVCGLVINLSVNSPELKIACSTIFILALCPMLYIFCREVRFFTNRWLQQNRGKRLTMGQDLAVTWLNVWLILMVVRLLISIVLLIFGYIRLSNSVVIETDSFKKAEAFFTVTFLYLDQPLIVGCSLTILTVYYKLGKKKYSAQIIREDTETRNIKGLMLQQSDVHLHSTLVKQDSFQANTLPNHKPVNYIETTQRPLSPQETDGGYLKTRGGELYDQQGFGAFASFILSEIRLDESSEPSNFKVSQF